MTLMEGEEVKKNGQDLVNIWMDMMVNKSRTRIFSKVWKDHGNENG